MKAPTFQQVRDPVLFVCGLAGIAWTTIVEQTERPTLLILFAAMIGLPAFLRADESRRNNNKNNRSSRKGGEAT